MSLKYEPTSEPDASHSRGVQRRRQAADTAKTLGNDMYTQVITHTLTHTHTHSLTHSHGQDTRQRHVHPGDNTHSHTHSHTHTHNLTAKTLGNDTCTQVIPPTPVGVEENLAVGIEDMNSAHLFPPTLELVTKP